MLKDSREDAIPTDIRELMDLFAEHLADVRFPDVDAAKLAELAGVVRDRAGELERLNQQVLAAQKVLDEAQSELRQSARRGLAYAKVYAEGDQALSGKLAAMTLDREPAADKPARKRKKPAAERGASGRAKKPTAELPFTPPEAVQ